jgi:hypothetical protein
MHAPINAPTKAAGKQKTAPSIPPTSAPPTQLFAGTPGNDPPCTAPPITKVSRVKSPPATAPSTIPAK